MFIAYVEMKRIISYGSTNVFQKYKKFPFKMLPT